MNRWTMCLLCLLTAVLFVLPGNVIASADELVLEQVNRVRAALEAARANETEKLSSMKQRYAELDAMKDRGEVSEDDCHKQKLRIRESYLIARVEFLGKLEDGIRQQANVYKKQKEAVEEPIQKLDDTIKDLETAENQSESDLKNLAQTQELIKLAMSRGVYIDTVYFNGVDALAPIHAENLEFIDHELKSIKDQVSICKNAQQRLQLLSRSADLRLMRVELQNRIAKSALKVTQILLEFETPIAKEFPTWLDPGKLEVPIMEDPSISNTKSSGASPANVDAGAILKKRGVDY